MRAHRLLTAALAGAVLLPASASAKPLVCGTFEDPRGDALPPPADLLGGGVRTTGDVLYGYLRVVTANAEAEPLAALGLRWDLTFRIAGMWHVMTVRYAPTSGYTASFTVAGETAKAPAFVVDRVRGMFSWSIPRTAVPGLAKRGAVLTDLAGATSLAGSGMDSATGGRPYVDGSPSGCSSAKSR